MTLKNDPKKSSLLRNMLFACDEIDLKKVVEDTLKVQGKSLTTVLDEGHFTVSLDSFPLLLVPQANPSFPKVCRLPSVQAKELPKLPLLFSC